MQDHPETSGRTGKTEMRTQVLFGVSLFALGLAIGLMVIRSDSSFQTPAAIAQMMRTGATGGIMAFTGQIDKDVYGIMMVDVDAGTLWVYQYRKAGNELKLLATRSWLYDRYLEEYNSAPPTPTEVAELIANQHRKNPAGGTTDPWEKTEP